MADNPKSPKNSALIGYRRPPPGFREGQSGNPAGRPKGASNRKKPRTQSERLRELMLKEAYRPIKTEVEGKEVTMPLAQAVLRSLAEAAAKGDARAQAMFVKLVSASEIEQEIYGQILGDADDAEPRLIEVRIVDPADARKSDG